MPAINERMHDTTAKPSPVISPKVYAAIWSSLRFRRMLLPEGILTNPYEILNYESTLTLHDPKGIRATFERTQEIRFLQDGVAGFLDHAWGDGVVLTSYHNEAGSLEECFKDEGGRHLVISMKRAMGRGEELSFGVARDAMVAFTKEQEWLETTIDHPIRRLSCNVIFPEERPCRYASLHYDNWKIPLPITRVPGGVTRVRFEIPEACAFTPYSIRWVW